MSPTQTRLEIWDYVSCAIIVLMTSCIGVYHVFASRKSRNTTEFLVKSQDLGIAPLILSAAATFTSAIGFLAIPVETYNNGVSFMVNNISMLLVIPFGVFLYLPVFYNLEISSIFQYLEVRFNRSVRLCASTLINLQVMLYTSCTIYAPALALNQVTGLHLWASVASVGIICIIYTSMGGIKAVVWADATQVVVMILVVVLIIVKGTINLGGIAEVWRICTEGKRAQYFVFTDSPHSRYSFWTIIFGATIHFVATMATNQMLIQRYICNKTLRNAKRSFIGGILTTDFLFVCNCICGLIMYARYHDCDPLINGQVTSRDQIMALFSMETLGFCTGLPGVFVAGILCATISTLSSVLNSLATITIEDYIKPSFPMLPDATQLWLSKILAVAYGVVCIALVLFAENIDGIINSVFIIHGVTGGPVLTLFTIGMALPWVNTWGAMSGFFAGLLLTGWASIGALITNPLLPNAPLSTSGCNNSAEWLSYNQSEVIADNVTFAPPMSAEPEAFALYTISSLWYASMSCSIGIVVSIIVSIFTGPRKPEEVNPKLLFPHTRILYGHLPKKCREWLGYDAGKRSYYQISMTDPDNSLVNNQKSASPKPTRVLPKYMETEMRDMPRSHERSNSLKSV